MPRLFLVMLLGSFLPLAAQANDMIGDATLRAVQFADESEGWAVGDDGVILHSIDGGDTWERQVSGTRASLRAVKFLNPYTGWAVGRTDRPEGGSAGVILHTTDGGLKWRVAIEDGMPGLRGVQFFDDKTGFVVGDGAGAAPSGVFQTVDGGRNWKPMPGGRVAAWNAVDGKSLADCALVGVNGSMGLVRDNSVALADVEALGGRSVRAVKIEGKIGFAVGQGGLIMASNSAGSKWGFPDLKLPEGVAQNCDFSALAWVGKHVFVAGRPGSMILHSDDLGRSWKLEKTGQPLPIEGLFFPRRETRLGRRRDGHDYAHRR